MSDPAWPQVGMIVSFVANPDSVALGLPECDRTRKVAMFCGTVVGVKAMVPHGPGKIPTAAVSVRGRRTSRVVTIDGVACFLAEHASFTEAEQRPFPFPT